MYNTYHTLHATNEQTVENLTRLVGVADILEGLGAILASDVQEDFLTTAVSHVLALNFLGGITLCIMHCVTPRSQKSVEDSERSRS